MKLPLKNYSDLLITYLKPQWLRVAFLTVLLFGGIGLQLLNPQILRYFIDTAQAGGETRSLFLAALAFIVVALIGQALGVATTYVSEHVTWTATNLLRADLARHCLQLDLPFHKAHPPGELIERIDGDVSTLANFFSQFVIQIAGNLLLLLGVLAVLFGEDWRIGLALTLFSLLMIWGLSRSQGLATPYWRAGRESGTRLFSFLEERLNGVEDIRSSAAGPYTMYRLFERMRDYLRVERRAGLMGSATLSLLFLFEGLGVGLVFVLAAFLVTSGGMTVGTAYMIFFYVGLIIQPLTVIANQTQDLQKATAGVIRIQELQQTRNSIHDGPGAELPAGPLAVTFDDVSFGYEPDNRILHNISFHLEPGRVLGILGRTGSGKTTLTRLLFRFYDPQQGAIELGGVDIRDPRVAELRSRIGIVTQDVQLFHASVRDNVTFFDETISDERIIAVLDELGLTAWYRSLPQGLDTLLGTRHSGLSAGEAQLLAFVRIFLKDPGLIILDEASARLDPATAHFVEQAVDKLLEHRTGIIIAHRLETLQRANEILLLDNGRICEYGLRQHLLDRPTSRFAQLNKTSLEEVLA